jgi:opacity protein-like surface antigen
VRRFLPIFAAVLLLSVNGFAQDDYPQIEAFVGYSYFNANDDDFEASTAPAFPDFDNLHGWNASVAGNVNRTFGLVADFSGHYTNNTVSGVELDSSLHNWLFGPRISARTEMVTPFAHVLFGGSRLKTDARSGGATVTTRDTSFAWGLGGGVDVNVGRNFAIRAIQADWIQTRFEPTEFGLPATADDSQNNARISVGVTFKFGGAW